MKQEQKRLLGGMDLDQDPDLIQDGDYVEAWNCIQHRGQNSRGRLFNLYGTSKNEHTYSGGGNKTVMHVCEDRPNDKIYYFVYSDNDYHYIIQFDVVTKANLVVYQSALLALDLSYPISAVVVNGWIIWTDELTGPRSLHIQRAINAQLATTPAYNGIDAAKLDFVRRPPSTAPVTAYGTDTARLQNNIARKVFQFSYRYVFFDYSRSVLGPYSDIIIPTQEEYANGLLNTDTSINNKIVVQCDAGSNIVQYVELLVRELRSDKSIGYWSLVKTWDRDEDTIGAGNLYSYDFLNDRGVQIDIDEALRPYDYVPRTAKSVAVIDKSRIIFGNYTAGYDQITPDVTLSYAHTVQANNAASNVTIPVTFFEEDFEQGRDPELIPRYVIIDIPSADNGKTYMITYSGDTYSYVCLAGDTTGDIAAALVALMVVDHDNVSLDGTDVKIEYADDYQVSAAVSGLPTTGTIVKQKNFKKGAFHPFGILYRDLQGRAMSVCQSDDTRIYIPFSTEQKEAGTLVDRSAVAITGPNYYTEIDYSISHTPPTGAATWQWVYLKNNLAWFQQYMVSEVKYINEPAVNKRVGFDVSTLINEVNARALKTELKTYTYTEGDRLRVISADGSTLVNTYLDFPIHGTFTDEDVEYVLVDNFTFSTYSLTSGSVVEIYRPDYEVRSIEDGGTFSDYDEQWRLHYFEMGDINTITETSGVLYHNTNGTDQTSIAAGTGTMTTGDSYLRVRLYLNGSIHVESDSISDYYESQAFHRGRMAMFMENMRETTYENGLVYGGSNNEVNDEINYMFSFNYDGYSHELALKDGEINKLITIGDNLKVFQRSKLSTIYIGRDAALTATGEEIVRTSDAVLGSIRPSVDDYGTSFPESVFADGTRIYFFDLYAKSFIVNTPGGNVNLSETYNISRYSKQLADMVLTQGSTVTISTAKDRFNNIIYNIYDSTEYTAGAFVSGTEYVIKTIGTTDFTLIGARSNTVGEIFTATDVGTGTGTTYLTATNRGVMYVPEIKKFKTFLNMSCELIAGWNKMVSFLAGDLYIHNEDSTNVGLVHAIQQEQKIKVVTKADPGMMKIFLSILIYSNHIERIDDKEYLAADILEMWSSKVKGDLSIPEDAMNTSGRETRLKPLRFERYRDHLYCTIPGDMNDPFFTDEDEALMNGREMKGQTMYVTIRNQAKSNVDTEMIVINYLND